MWAAVSSEREVLGEVSMLRGRAEKGWVQAQEETALAEQGGKGSCRLSAAWRRGRNWEAGTGEEGVGPGSQEEAQ